MPEFNIKGCVNCIYRHTKFGWSFDPPEVRNKIWYCGIDKIPNTDHFGIKDLPEEKCCDKWKLCAEHEKVLKELDLEHIYNRDIRD